MDLNPRAPQQAGQLQATDPVQAVHNFNSFHVHSLFHLPNKLIMETLKGFQKESHYKLHILPYQSIVLSFLHSMWERKGFGGWGSLLSFLISSSPGSAFNEYSETCPNSQSSLGNLGQLN